IVSFAVVLGAASAIAQDRPAPAAVTGVQETTPPAATATTVVQELPAPASAAAPSAEPQKEGPSAAIASTPTPAAKPTAKRTAARQHSAATRERPRVADPGYASPL